MTTTNPLRYWAIRVGPYLEIRSARTRPKAITSKLTRTTKKTYNHMFVDDDGKFVQKPREVEKKVILKQVFYEGGRVLGILKYTKVYRYALLEDNEIKEITKDIKDMCLKKRLS